MRATPAIAKRAAITLALAVCACSPAAPAADPMSSSSAANGGVAAPAQGSSGSSASSGTSTPSTESTPSAPATSTAKAGAAAPTAASAAASQNNATPSAGRGGTGTASPSTTAAAGASMLSAGSGATAAQTPAVACNGADMLPEAKNVPLDSITGSSNPAPIVPAKGPLMPVVEHDPGLDTHTVYRPMVLGETKYPLVVWANGGCVKNGTMFARFLLEIASHGFVVVADGKPNGSGGGSLDTDGGPQTAAMEWLVAENDRPCSKYYRKLDTTKIAAMGQSCGGLMTLGASSDKRLTTIMIWNSGLFERDEMIYSGLHTPVAYIIGGPDDVAYPQAEDDFAAINTVPIFYGNNPVGHTGTYAQDNGGEFAQVGVAWLKWQLYGETSETTSGMFQGADCGLCTDSKWTVEKKMMD